MEVKFIYADNGEGNYDNIDNGTILFDKTNKSIHLNGSQYSVGAKELARQMEILYWRTLPINPFYMSLLETSSMGNIFFNYQNMGSIDPEEIQNALDGTGEDITNDMAITVDLTDGIDHTADIAKLEHFQNRLQTLFDAIENNHVLMTLNEMHSIAFGLTLESYSDEDRRSLINGLRINLDNSLWLAFFGGISDPEGIVEHDLFNYKFNPFIRFDYGDDTNSVFQFPVTHIDEFDGSSYFPVHVYLEELYEEMESATTVEEKVNIGKIILSVVDEAVVMPVRCFISYLSGLIGFVDNIRSLLGSMNDIYANYDIENPMYWVYRRFGFLDSIRSLFYIVREKNVQAGNGVNTEADKNEILSEAAPYDELRQLLYQYMQCFDKPFNQEIFNEYSEI